MEQQKIENATVKMNLCDGVVLGGQKMSGSAVVDMDNKVVTFTQNEKRVRQNAKNPVIYGGTYLNVRLHSDGATQMTMKLGANTNVDVIRTALVDDFSSALNKLCKLD